MTDIPKDNTVAQTAQENIPTQSNPMDNIHGTVEDISNKASGYKVRTILSTSLRPLHNFPSNLSPLPRPSPFTPLPHHHPLQSIPHQPHPIPSSNPKHFQTTHSIYYPNSVSIHRPPSPTPTPAKPLRNMLPRSLRNLGAKTLS